MKEVVILDSPMIVRATVRFDLSNHIAHTIKGTGKSFRPFKIQCWLIDLRL